MCSSEPESVIVGFELCGVFSISNEVMCKKNGSKRRDRNSAKWITAKSPACSPVATILLLEVS